MRCLFQISIPDNLDVAEQLLDQVQAHAAEAAEVNIRSRSQSQDHHIDVRYRPINHIRWKNSNGWRHEHSTAL